MKISYALLHVEGVTVPIEIREECKVGSHSRIFDGSPEAMFADERLIAEAGLLTPPVYEISKALAAKHPGSLLQPTLSVPVLVDSIGRMEGRIA